MKESDGFMLSINEMVDRIRVVNQCMKHSIKEHDPDDSINEFLKEIGTAVNASAIYLYTLKKNHDYVCGFAWISEKDKTHEPVLALRGKDLAEEWRQKLDRGDSISVPDLRSIALKEPQAYKTFSQMGISSMIMCPITIEEELYGFVVFSNLDASYNQTGNQLYEIDANFLAIMLRHQRNVTYIYENELEDKLTKLMNMRTFGMSLDTILMAVKYGRTDKEWAVVFFDLQHFKVYNNEYGIYEGDKLLKKMASILKDELGDGMLARFESDHFYALVEDVAAESLIKRVSDRLLRETDHKTGVRAGIYRIDGSEKKAIQACDRAKLAGDMSREDFSRYFRRYVPEMEDSLKKTSYIIGNLEKAIENGWIRPAFQPISNLVSGRAVFYETLARWIDPVYGFMNPGEFIGILERNHLIHLMDFCILEQACKVLSEEGHDEWRVSVNLSRMDFDLPDLHERINDILAQYAITHDRIFIEITESALAEREEMLKSHIEQFHADGYQVWLDDFGSGYSSFNALQSFDFDVMKLDMMFLRHRNERTGIILPYVISMAKRLDIVPLIEGVETADQAAEMKDIGCCLAQGYYYSKPLLLDDLWAWYSNHPLETKEEYEFLKELGMIDVISVLETTQNKPNVINMKQTMGIFYIEENNMCVVYMSSGTRDWMEKHCLEGNEDVSRFNDESTDIFAQKLRVCIRRLKRVNDFEYEPLEMEGFKGKICVQFVNQDKKRRGYVVTTRRLDEELARTFYVGE